MLKFEGKFAVGDTIRSYDFFGRRDCFVEGIVLEAKSTELGYAAYKIRCTRRVFAGNESAKEVGVEFFAPHEVSFCEYNDRLEQV